MIKLQLELDDEQYNFEIPECWDEVNVEQFCKIMELQESVKDLTKISTSVKLINIITDIDEEIIWLMSGEDFSKLTKALSFTSTEIKAPLKDSIVLDGEEYFVKSNFEELTMGEIITLEQLTDSSKGNIFKSMDKLLTIFLRKKKPNGNLESFKVKFIEERAHKFNKISITDIYTLFFSFIDGENSSVNDMKVFSVDKKQKVKNQIGLQI